uniref:Uncharacterized protein n=1 Tax=Anguilla anguilla TaxID=7936 RepID=A0A0E9RPF8_ANGAN
MFPFFVSNSEFLVPLKENAIQPAPT